MTTRAQIVAAARSFLGVPWRHQGRSREGVDCVGLLICVGHELEMTQFDFRSYTFASDPQVLFDKCEEHLVNIPIEQAQPGDMVTISYLKVPHHMGFLGDYVHGGLSLIHALNLWERKVIEHRLDDAWKRRIVRAYAAPGVE